MTPCTLTVYGSNSSVSLVDKHVISLSSGLPWTIKEKSFLKGTAILNFTIFFQNEMLSSEYP
jgi:hypothetical protein